MENQVAQLMKEASREDLLSFCVYTDKFFEINRHHEIIADKLQAFMEWKIKRLILQTPPRSWKSRLICEAIAHSMWKLENTDIIYTWHTISLLEWFSRNIRARVDSPEYKELFKDRIKDWNGWVNQWSMTNWNQLMIYWVWWAITGKWWHRLIIDDPYATRQDAESETIRARVKDWYNSTFYSRRHNQDTWICLIMQRWREDDLVWELLQQDDWEVVKIPAIDSEWRSFWENRFDVKELENIRKQIWDYFFASQYQQDPINEWGWDFTRDYIQYYQEHLMPTDLEIVTFIDPAISQKQEADNTAIVTIWLDKRSNNIYILEVLAGKMLPDEIINNTFKTYLKWKPKRIWIEVVAYQKMLAIELRKQMNIRNIFFVLDEIHPQWEKVSRIRTILQPRYSNLSIFHNNTCNDLELELLKFPNGKHDDMIDALASAVNMLNTFNISHKPKVFVPNYAWI
jgi:predicted phage terminase large subunit-like protein